MQYIPLKGHSMSSILEAWSLNNESTSSSTTPVDTAGANAWNQTRQRQPEQTLLDQAPEQAREQAPATTPIRPAEFVFDRRSDVHLQRHASHEVEVLGQQEEAAHSDQSETNNPLHHAHPDEV